MGRILIVGVGNTLMGDDGLGVHTLDLLRSRELPGGVDTLKGGTSLIHALPDLTPYDKLILLDAIENDEDGVMVIRNAELDGFPQHAISLHELGIEDVLRLVLLETGHLPEVVIMGVRPERIAFRTDLCAATSARIGELVDTVMHEIRRGDRAH